jgi:hypothetical protein
VKVTGLVVLERLNKKATKKFKPNATIVGQLKS